MSKSRGGFVGMLAEGFSLPLVGLAVLLGALYGLSQHEFESSGIEGKDPPASTGSVDPVDGMQPKRKASRKDVERALSAGEFKRAYDYARTTGNRKLLDKARLFWDLTRSIKPNEFAQGKGVVQLTVGSGQQHVGIVRTDGDELVLELPDGQEARVRAAGVKSREPLEGDAASQALSAYFKTARANLGEEPSGLALHRLSFLAIAAGQGRVGAHLLEEALVGAEGGILVDMFGESDFERLHRARRVLAGLPEEDPTELALLDVRDRRNEGSRPRDPDPVDRDPVDPPDRDPVDPIDPDPLDRDPVDRDPQFDTIDSDVTRGDQRVGERHEKVDPTTDPALTDKRWKAADAAYRSGLELYRGSFGVSPRITAAAIRAALKEFQRAQDQLNSLLRDHGEHHVVERRQMELNQLVLDCMKRQNVD